MYKVDLDWAPAYELAISYEAYTRKGVQKGTDLKPSWSKAVAQQLDPAFAAALEQGPPRTMLLGDGLDLLINRCPGERTPAQFLTWLGSLSTGELYEWAAAHLRSVPPNLAELRENTVSVLSQWHTQYFAGMEPTLTPALSADLAAKRRLADAMSPMALVEQATDGFELGASERLELVLLVPQSHLSPTSYSNHYPTRITCFYPVEVETAAPGEPSAALLRVIQALGDPSRLRMLRFIAEQPRSFKEIVQFSGLSKGNVHYHLVTLRSAGLVRVHTEGSELVGYSIRAEAFERLGALVSDYVLPNR